MATRHSIIEPFPDHIDREAFGHWLSGFTDGEATFAICRSVKKGETRTPRGSMGYRPYFAIALRDDDMAILEIIQRFFQCGYMQFIKKPNRNVPNAKPSARLRIDDLENIVASLIPHFDKYPLRAKKRHDFTVWKEAVLMLWERKKRKTHTKIGRKGTLPKWSDTEYERFLSLWSLLREARKYNAKVAIIPELSAPRHEQHMLF